MKHMAFLVLALFAATAAAQAPATKEAAKPEAAKAAAKEPMKEPAKAEAPKKPRRWNEDARHCLERGSSTDIIKCAEEFL